IWRWRNAGWGCRAGFEGVGPNWRACARIWRWRNAGWLWAPGAHVRCGGRELAFMCPDMAVEERRLARGGGAVGGAGGGGGGGWGGGGGGLGGGGGGDADRRPSGQGGDGRAPVGRPLERADQGGVA